MCLIGLAWRPRPGLRLVVAANRDERHDRPAAPLGRWTDAAGVIAGRDLEGGGTWMGVASAGRFAALTAVREPGRAVAGAPSRGGLVAGYLRGDAAPREWAEHAQAVGGSYNGFNLIVGDPCGLWYVSNRGRPAEALGPGIHGLSNHLLDTPWPKVNAVRRALEEALAETEPGAEVLLGALADRRIPPDHELPDTGVGVERERLLGPVFIVHPAYGTRCSTALLVRDDGSGWMVERSFARDGSSSGTTRLELSAG